MNARKKIVVGLGNPGKEFETTYHNAGALAVKKIAEGCEFRAYKKLFLFAADDRAAFVIPLAFMNESGAAVQAAMKKFKGSAKDLIVIHDESDLAIGTYKVSAGKNSAGHKGVQSIMDTLHTKDFTRIRIGIRPKEEKKRKKASVFVLKKISHEDRKTLRGVFADIASALPPLF